MILLLDVIGQVSSVNWL